MDFKQLAKEVFQAEVKAIKNLENRINADFEQAVHYLNHCDGRLVVCGMGKSGLIGKKIAATFASIGLASVFIHPSEAIHGDLGMLMKGDCFLSISNSGETDELLQLLPYVKSLSMPHIALVGNSSSTLAKYADAVLDISVEKEASSIQALPMASIISTLAMADALTAALIKVRNFQQKDFLQYHPGGSLGRKLVTKVEDLMQKKELPIVLPNQQLRQVLFTMSEGRLGLAVVCDEENKVLGVITDGDLRRALEKSDEKTFYTLEAQDIMSKDPKTIQPGQSIIEAEELMKLHRITSLLMLDGNRLLGILNKQHLNI